MIMSLKSFDEFCAKMVNNDPVQQKEIFDERQKLVRSQLTIRALWAFVIVASINILVMECGPQWCESWVLSTAMIGAAAYLYWVIANAHHGTLIGVSGTSAVTQSTMFLVDGLMIPFVFIMHDKDSEPVTDFFFHDGMVSENLLAIIAGVFLIVAAAVTMSSAYHYQKLKRNDGDS